MRASFRFVRSVAALSALLLCGCPEDAPPVCTDACTDLTFDVVVVGEGVEVPVTDGARVPWVYGFQGGAMIRPMLVFDDASGVVDGDYVEVTLTHAEDPADPAALGMAAEFPELTVGLRVRDDGGRLVVGPIDDQVGWDMLDGTRFILGATARTDAAAGELSAPVVLDQMRAASACDVFATTGGGCVYRVIPGIATVTSIDDPPAGSASCPGGQAVSLSFAADDPEQAAACVAELPFGGDLDAPRQLLVFGNSHPPSSCFDTVGIEVGAELPAQVEMVERGTCSPETFRLADTVDLTSCNDACM